MMSLGWKHVLSRSGGHSVVAKNRGRGLAGLQWVCAGATPADPQPWAPPRRLKRL